MSWKKKAEHLQLLIENLGDRISKLEDDGKVRIEVRGGEMPPLVWEKPDEPPLPTSNFQKWAQTYWWKSNQGWKALTDMDQNHIDNVVCKIEENPEYFMRHIRDEIKAVFDKKFDPTNVSIESALRASLDLIWMDSYPLEYMTASPLYKALKELRDGQSI